MRYAYLPANRGVWFEVAEKLSARGWVPAVWLGHPDHDAAAHARFPDCDFIPFWASHQGDVVGDASPPPQEVVASEIFRVTRDRVVMTMDRLDATGTYRRVDREAAFYRLASVLWQSLEKGGVEVVIHGEVPHLPAALTLDGLARAAGVPVLHWAPSTIAPAMMLRSRIGGPAIAPPTEMRPQHREIVEDRIATYLDRFSAADLSYEAIRPTYMADAAVTSSVARRSPYRQARRHLGRLRRRLTSPAGGLMPFDVSRSWSLQDRPSAAVWEPRRAVDAIEYGWLARRSRWATARALKRAHDEHVTRVPEGRYVFFPLHYEPERTTNPEGMDFYHQFDAVLVLRAALPPDVHLLIKEHPAQFFPNLAGPRGRSPAAYPFLSALPGVSLAPHEEDQLRLIRGAEAVFAVTGTAALEAACVGTPSAVLGDPWFRGCPGVTKIDARWDGDVGALRSADHDQIRTFLRELLLEKAVFGAINKSSGKLFPEGYALDDPDVAEAIAGSYVHALADPSLSTDRRGD